MAAYLINIVYQFLPAIFDCNCPVPCFIYLFYKDKLNNRLFENKKNVLKFVVFYFATQKILNTTDTHNYFSKLATFSYLHLNLNFLHDEWAFAFQLGIFFLSIYLMLMTMIMMMGEYFLCNKNWLTTDNDWLLSSKMKQS